MRRLKKAFIIFIAVLAASNCQAYAQNNQNVIEIISLSLPDSVVFKFAKGEGEKFKMATLILVDGKKVDQPKVINVESDNTEVSTQHGISGNFTDETVVRALGFNKNFKAKKLHFALLSCSTGKMIFVDYDIEKKKWE
jgi:hypothetical protein